MRNARHILAFLLLTTALAVPATAQETDNSALMERLDRLEHDTMLLQRQIARGGASSSGDSGAPLQNAAQLEVRLSAMEDEMREMRGKIEENGFQVKKLSDTLDKMQRDTDFRFNELSQHGAGAPPLADAALPDADAAPKKIELNRARKPLNANIEASASEPKTSETADGETTAGNGVLEMPDGSAASPRDLYNTAIRLFNQQQYDQAATSFEGFTKKYPNDPLIGNAYYWLGDTYFKRKDYVNAADDFRQGFEALPTGPKAADNLLKLAMSLNALKRDKEACIVLSQVLTKFKTSSTSIAQKATQEQTRIGCK